MKLRGEDKAGIYITVIIHLTVIIILLICQIGATLQKENSFVIDFSRQEAAEKRRAQEKFNEDIRRKLDEMIAGKTGTPIKNVSVDRNENLKDDRGTDAQKLYDDADRLHRQLRQGARQENPDDFAQISENKTAKDDKKSAYKGPSVISYSLDGRKASRLPVPAYKCMDGGLVTVIIVVNNQGSVIDAKVQEGISSENRCLREYAVRAAKASRFSASSTAPARQTGDIVYQFLAQ